MITAIIQARMGSTRLPGKVLKEISGHSMLWHVVTRVRHANTLDQVVVATSNQVSDDAIASFCEQEGFLCFRGSESDVLDRYYQAARWAGATVVVRITGDCPLIDPVVIDKVVSAYLESDYDYVSNVMERTYPDGLDTEVFSFELLSQAWRNANLLSEREHVTTYIRKNKDLFTFSHITQEQDLSELRWTVDHPEDLLFIREIYNRLYQSDEIFLAKDVVQFLRQRAELLEINKNYKTGEGYLRSLQNDRMVSLPVESDDADASDDKK